MVDFLLKILEQQGLKKGIKTARKIGFSDEHIAAAIDVHHKKALREQMRLRGMIKNPNKTIHKKYDDGTEVFEMDFTGTEQIDDLMLRYKPSKSKLDFD